MSVMPIAEARRRLPELVRRVASGHAPILIGRRGQPQAVLAPATAAAPGDERQPLVGLLQILGGPEEIERAGAEERAAIEASLDRTARLIAGSPPRRRRRARGR